MYAPFLRHPVFSRVSLALCQFSCLCFRFLNFIFIHRSGADITLINFGLTTTSAISGAECCRFSGGRPLSTGSGHSQGPLSSGSSCSGAAVVPSVVACAVVVGQVLGAGGTHGSGLPRVRGSSGLNRGHPSSGAPPPPPPSPPRVPPTTFR